MIYDLASLALRWGPSRASLTLEAGDGTLLSVIDAAPDQSPRELAFLAADDALARARVSRPDRPGGYDGTTHRLRIGLYNPFTGQVSVGATPRTAVYAGTSPLSVTVRGLYAVVDTESLTLTDGRVLTRETIEWSSLTRLVEAHTL